MNRLVRIIAPALLAAGLDIREMTRADGEVRELVITNPRHPARGRVIVDRHGFMEWDYWGHTEDDAGAARLAAVITAIMAPAPPATPRTPAPAPPSSHPPNTTGRTPSTPPAEETPPSSRLAQRRQGTRDACRELSPVSWVPASTHRCHLG